MSEALDCVHCGASMERALGDKSPEWHPDGGVHCSTTGNYGSAIFDPLGEATIHFVLCDGCLTEALEEGAAVEVAEKVDFDHIPLTLSREELVGITRSARGSAKAEARKLAKTKHYPDQPREDYEAHVARVEARRALWKRIEAHAQAALDNAMRRGSAEGEPHAED